MKRILLTFAALVASFTLYGTTAQAQTTPNGFSPCSNATLSASSSSSNALLSTCGSTVVVWNIGSQEAFVSYGPNSTQAATTGSMSIPSGAGIVLQVGNGNYLAAITSTSTTTLRVAVGYGFPALAGSGTGGGGSGGAVTIADGADVAEGSRADTAYAGSGNATTISGLKGLYNSIASLITAVQSSIPAGTNIIGQVGIDQTTPGVTNAVVPLGTAASGAPNTSNPLKFGCIYNSTLSTGTTGNILECQSSAKGRPLVAVGASGTATDGFSNTMMFGTGGEDTQNATRLYSAGTFNLNDSNLWDRQFTCTNSAVVNVTAGNTTELVALTAAKIVRICSMALTSSLTGTATVVYGTGTNCGTGTTSLTGAMTLTTGIPLALSAANGSLLRGASANAVCLTAATGNITGFISYAKF